MPLLECTSLCINQAKRGHIYSVQHVKHMQSKSYSTWPILTIAEKHGMCAAGSHAKLPVVNVSAEWPRPWASQFTLPLISEWGVTPIRPLPRVSKLADPGKFPRLKHALNFLTVILAFYGKQFCVMCSTVVTSIKPLHWCLHKNLGCRCTPCVCEQKQNPYRVIVSSVCWCRWFHPCMIKTNNQNILYILLTQI